MCRRVECSTCGRPTFAGCGQHIEQVLGDVPPAQRCRCSEEKRASEKNTATTKSPVTWLKELFSK